VDFTIVTPSLRQLDWLACCIASVADQEGVTLEHVVQDAGTDGFAEFAEKMRRIWPDRQGYRRIMVSEPDQGMYDAVNKGLKKGIGRFCAYLNCDEQYLPGALARVKGEFEKAPKAEILYGGFLVVNDVGQLITAQRPVKMFWQHVATSHLPNFTCATFFRRSMLNRDQAWFDPAYQACGDAAWAVERLQKGVPTRGLPFWTSLFTENRDSVGLGEVGKMEARQLRSRQSFPVRLTGALWVFLHRVVKLFSGGYLPPRVSTQVYAPGNPSVRQALIGRTSPFWDSRILARN